MDTEPHSHEAWARPSSVRVGETVPIRRVIGTTVETSGVTVAARRASGIAGWVTAACVVFGGGFLLWHLLFGASVGGDVWLGRPLPFSETADTAQVAAGVVAVGTPYEPGTTLSPASTVDVSVPGTSAGGGGSTGPDDVGVTPGVTVASAAGSGRATEQASGTTSSATNVTTTNVTTTNASSTTVAVTTTSVSAPSTTRPRTSTTSTTPSTTVARSSSTSSTTSTTVDDDDDDDDDDDNSGSGGGGGGNSGSGGGGNSGSGGGGGG